MKSTRWLLTWPRQRAGASLVVESQAIALILDLVGLSNIRLAPISPIPRFGGRAISVGSVSTR
jgi:hypothetical protein